MISTQTLLIVSFSVAFTAFIIFIGWLIAQSFAKKLFAAPAKLGTLMGLDEKVQRIGRKQGDWYGGQFEKKEFALTYITQKGRSHNINGDTRSTVRPHLRLVMAFNLKSNQSIDLHRKTLTTWAITDFESIFRSKKLGIESLSKTQKENILNFALKFKSLRIKSRSELNVPFLPLPLFEKASLVLMLDTEGIEHTPEHVNQHLQAMSELINALENGNQTLF